MKAIVVGIDSFLGKALDEGVRAGGGETYGTSRRPDAAARGLWYLDLADPLAGETILPQADVAFFCAAMTQFAACRAEPARARQINVSAPAALARRLAERGTRVVLLSTSAVYDGRMARVPSSEPPAPATEYGRLKAQAEAQFLALGDVASIVRLTKVLEAQNALFVRWIEMLSRGGTVAAFADLGLAPISLTHAVRALLAAACDRAGGIYQASASGDISYADAARHIALRLGINSARVAVQSGADAGLSPEQLTLLSSLDTSRLSALTGQAAPDPYRVIDLVFSEPIERASRGAMKA